MASTILTTQPCRQGISPSQQKTGSGNKQAGAKQRRLTTWHSAMYKSGMCLQVSGRAQGHITPHTFSRVRSRPMPLFLLTGVVGRSLQALTLTRIHLTCITKYKENKILVWKRTTQNSAEEVMLLHALLVLRDEKNEY